MIDMLKADTDSFFRKRGNPPVIGVSDAAAALRIDEHVVRRWCRENNLWRVGPNFVLTRENVTELGLALTEGL